MDQSDILWSIAQQDPCTGRLASPSAGEGQQRWTLEVIRLKDLISRATFGFFMAQLFPGTIAAFGIAFVYYVIEFDLSDGVLSAANFVLQTWNSEQLGSQLFLLGLFIGVGMFIHGLHWASLGALESRFKSVYDSYWHDRLLVWQVLLGPVKLIRENVDLFFRTKHIRDASVRENLPTIHKDHMAHFEFIQDFYLYSAQFFAHTSYALLVLVGAVAFYAVAYGFTLRRLCLLGLAYILGGVFFVLGRIQLRSMFLAEFELANCSPRARALNQSIDKEPS